MALPKFLSLFLAIILGLAIFPSFRLSGDFGLLGHLNSIKIASPLLAIIAFLAFRNSFSTHRRIQSGLLVFLAVGSASLVIAGYGCDYPRTLLSEWSVVVLGLMGALTLACLSDRMARGVLTFWACVILSLGVIEYFTPELTKFLLSRFFDPETYARDLHDVTEPTLVTIFGRQSGAKLIALSPFLFLLARPAMQKKLAVVLFSAAGFLLMSVGQRGPFWAFLLGGVALLCQLAWSRGLKKQVLALASLGLIGFTTVMGLYLFNPSAMIFDGISKDSLSAIPKSVQTTQFRLSMYKLSLSEISKNPLGNPCIESAIFDSYGISPGHSHNVFLQAFRELGWVYGIAHLLLWIAALGFAWKQPTGHVLFGAVVTLMGMGIFDHLWTVINHALVIWVFILSAFGVFRIPTKTASNP